MVPAWMVEEMRRKEQERQEAEERSRQVAEVPLPLPSLEEQVEETLKKMPKVIEIQIW